MMNQLILVGRITKEVELKELENGGKVANITLAISRPYKNEEGLYETDFINCTLYNIVAQSAFDYARKGDIIGVKGRLQSRIVENEDGTKSYKMEVIAEKVTFLSSKKNDEEYEDN